ncbi:hypothetical protein HIJ39_15465 [Sulfobacillus sp. DSM 109850]|uniref:DNA methylase N-4/N-6 domain-containing protein n=2 Tax=Sulfobacillus harzensis TaxID=2729629 RepID=A0A7Y0L5T3_9FIRM|nr:hypothetical protein [Sulfobacillus harzensis]
MRSPTEVETQARRARVTRSALQTGFPVVPISRLAERESWRKEVNRPLYHIHKWWATRLGSVFRAIVLGTLADERVNTWDQFYELHNFHDKVVLDPFMGSGTTLGEAAKLGANVVGADINPVSTFLVQQALTRVSADELRRALHYLEETVAPQIQMYYQTPDRVTGEMVPVLYYFWVKEVETPTGEHIALFDRYVFSQHAYPKKHPSAQILCPACWHVFGGRYDLTAVVCPSCDYEFNPQIGPVRGAHVVDSTGVRYRIKDLLPKGRPPRHRMYAMLVRRATGEKSYWSISPADEALYAAAAHRLEQETLPLPTMPVRSGHNTDQARGYHYYYWRDFFNARQLLTLGLLLRGILSYDELQVQEQLLCLFSSTLEFNNMFCSFKGEGTGAVRHMFSHHILKPERTPLENSVWGSEKSSGTFMSLFESRLLKAKAYLDNPFELALADGADSSRGTARATVSCNRPLNTTVVSTWDALQRQPHSALVLNADSRCLPIPDRSVDAVVTDPPYFDFVHYSELSDFFFAWLAPVLRNRYPYFARQDSSDSGEVQHVEPLTFSQQLEGVFTECRRVLRDEGVMAFTFHHSRADGWAAVYQAVINAGFVVVKAYPVHGELRGASPKSGTKDPISLDAVLVCVKRSMVDSVGTSEGAVMSAVTDYQKELESAGMQLSSADHFVIMASQYLVDLQGRQVPMATIITELSRGQSHMAGSLTTNIRVE